MNPEQLVAHLIHLSNDWRWKDPEAARELAGILVGDPEMVLLALEEARAQVMRSIRPTLRKEQHLDLFLFRVKERLRKAA